MNAIEIKNLVKDYGNFRALKNVNLTIKEGDFYGFIGPNGAGKTTTIKSMLNIIQKTSGDVSILGADHACNLFQKDIGYVPGEANLYDNLTVKEQIDYFKGYYEAIDEKYLNQLIKKFDLSLNKKIKSLSLGNKKKLAIVLSLMHKPKLLILDEITNGLDPLMQKTTFDELVRLNKAGTTIFLSSHNLDDISKYCQRIAIIKDGSIVLDDLKENIINNEVVVSIKGTNIQESLDKWKIDYTIVEENYRFIYRDNVNELLSKLSKLEIEKINITDMRLEDIFESFIRSNYETDDEFI